MVNYDLLFLVIFFIMLLIIFRVYRKKFEVQWKIFALYKTKWGIDFMDKFAKKFPRFLTVLGYFSIIIGFIGMVITLVFIVYSTYKLLFVPETEAALAPLLPGVSISDKLPILSFWHWILAILIIAVVHEASHGIYARLVNVKIKSSGFAFLGPILAAFVEPDEQELKKKRTRDQLMVFSAGPFSNILLAVFIFLIIIFVSAPIVGSMVNTNGLIISGVNETLPIAASGLVAGHILQEIEGEKIDSANVISDVLASKKPGDTVQVKANNTNYQVVLSSHPEDKNKAFLGLSFSKFSTELKNKSLGWLFSVLGWINMLLFWSFNISLGVGLFNLLPLGPIDGGRMFHAAMTNLTKNEKTALKILSFVSIVILAMIIINMAPFILRFFRFVISPFS